MKKKEKAKSARKSFNGMKFDDFMHCPACHNIAKFKSYRGKDCKECDGVGFVPRSAQLNFFEVPRNV